MAGASLIILSALLTLYLLWVFTRKKQQTPDQASKLKKTGWVSAIIWGLFIAIIFGDPIVVRSLNMAVWGEVSIFFAVFFIQIFLDNRTKFRGTMALVSVLNVGAFYCVYLH